VAAAGSEGRICSWSVKTGERLHRFKGTDKDLASLAILADGSIVAAPAEGFAAWQWNALSGKRVPCLSELSRQTCDVRFTRVFPSTPYLLTTGTFRRNWEGRIDDPDLGHGTSLELVRATGGMVGIYGLQLWHVGSGLRARSFDSPYAMGDCLAVSREGARALAATENGGGVLIWGLG
jgi:WD40 repeat protein